MSRVLVIGWDGAEPSLVERWMDDGSLPNLAQLRNTGAYLRCASTIPPATFPAWTTCVTGVNPGRHGMFDFTELTPGAYAVRFVNSSFRRAPAVWNVLSSAGRRVGVIGVPGTHPPEPVNGFMVSGFDAPVTTRIDRSFVYPPELYATARDWVFADFQESRIGPGWHGMALRSMIAAIDTKRAIALDLLRREPWDFFMVVFGESDTVAHHFWLFHDAGSPRHVPGFEDAIHRVYQRLDAATGALIDAAQGDVLAVVVSDHGFGGAGDGVLHINNRLAELGCFAFTARGRGGWLKRLAMTAAPPAWRGALFRMFRGAAERAESAARFGGIDWERTRAWSEELNYFPSVRVNLEGREPFGQVAAGEYDSFCEDLCAALEAWPPVRKAWRRDALYHGPYVDRAPDIVLDLRLENGYSYSCLRSPAGGPAERRMLPQERFGGKERGMTGNHRGTGILFLSMPSAARTARLEDVAPTILGHMGVPGPPMDGTSLLAPAAVQSESGGDSGRAARPYTTEEEKAVEDRLRALGYFE